MRFTRTARNISIGMCALTAVSASFAQEVLKIEDQGSLRSFVLVEDEVLLRGETRNEARLKDDVEADLPGARVLETRGSEALAKLDHRINRQKAAGRMEVIQQSAPQYYSEPVLYPENGARTPNTRRYVGPRVLVKLKEGQDPEQLRAQSGAAQVESGILDGHVMLTFRDGWQSLDASESLKAQGLEARPLLRKLVERMWVPNDPYFLQQWHLKNRGQGGGLVGADANVVPAWEMAKGDNVTVVVVDDSLQTTHPDIAPSTEPVSANVHIDYRDGGNDPGPTASDDAHGTSVGGVIAAKGNNGIGGTGAAPNAKLLGVRLIGGYFDAATARNALLWQPAGHTSSVSNNSWGYGGAGMNPLDPIERQALQDAATTRRGGLGQVTLFAAANNDRLFNGYAGSTPTYTSQDANYQNYANSRFVIGVAACTNYGNHSYYSNRGASVLICAPSNGGSLGIFTTDNVGVSGYNSALDPSGQPTDKNYTNSFGGTSSATPLTSGVVALMLSANPGLGYRDVMEILATTAKKIDAGSSDWVTNGAGFHFAHAYGAGMVDAAAAVARSLQWTNLPAQAPMLSRTASSLPLAIPETPSPALVRTFDFSTSANLRVEHVEAVIRATHGNRSDLEITLTSPSGTRSVLNPIRVRPDVNYTGDDDNDIGDSVNGGWIYMTTHNWGENSSGTWTLSIRDGTTGVTGTLDSAQVRIYGTPAVNSQRVHFTQQSITTLEDAGTVNLTVERLGPTNSTVSVGYSVAGGTAVSGTDFNLAAGTVTFGPGETQKTITLSLIDDADPEGLESIYVILSNPVGASLGGSSLCSVLIPANDGNFVTLSAQDSEAAENPHDNGSFMLTRIVAEEPLDVALEISGTAMNGVDYETIPSTVTFPAGVDTLFITVNPKDDTQGEGAEGVTIALAPPQSPDYQIGEPSEGSVTILDNERPSIELRASAEQISETSAGTTLTVSRGQTAGVGDLKVDLFIGGSALPGTDYVELPDSVTILAGQTEAVLEIKPLNNASFNPTRTVLVALAPGPDYGVGFDKQKTVYITNDDPAPDIKRPGVTIVSPKPGQRFDASAIPPLMASGLARDNIEVKAVQYRVNYADWLGANFDSGTGVWSIDLAAASRPGPNWLEVRSIDKDDNLSSVVGRAYTVVLPRKLTISTAGPDGSGTVRPGVGEFQLEAGQTYTIAARPATNFIFAGWSGDIAGTAKSLTFVMPVTDTAITAAFVPNPFVEAVTGRFAGLVAGPTSAPETSGLADLTVTKTGAFSGKLWHNGKAFPLKGEFNGVGRFVGSVKRGKQTPLSVDLTLDLDPSGTHAIAGTITGRTPTGEPDPANVTALRCAYSKTNPLDEQYARSYTFYLPPKFPSIASGDSNNTKPHGNGIGTLTISTAGIVKWTGTLGDGSPATQTTVLSAAKTWPLYVAVNNGMGYISGNVTHDPLQAGSDFSASLNWVKKPVPRDRMFPLGFTIEGTSLMGVDYTEPLAGTRVLTGYDSAPGNAGPLTLKDGNLAGAGIAKVLTLLSTNKTTIEPIAADKLTISIAPKTGVVSGKFIFPVTKKLTPIKGVILQNKIGKGVGGYIGSDLNNINLQTGRLEFRPQ